MELKQTEREDDGMGVIAFVTVKIPVGLIFEGPVDWDHMRAAALENFLDHPAIAQDGHRGRMDKLCLADLEMFVQEIEVTHG